MAVDWRSVLSSEMSRRRLLALGGGALGAAAAGSLLPPSLQAAMAAEPHSGGFRRFGTW